MAPIRVAVSCVCLAVARSVPVPIKDAAPIIGGVVEGFLSEKPDLKTCVSASVTALSDLDVVVKNLGKNDLVDRLRGLRTLAEALHELPVMLKACKAIAEDIEEMQSALSQIHSPAEFAFHVGKDLLVNHHNIYGEVQAAVVAWHAHKFEGFGIQVGEALRQLTLGSAQDLFDAFVTANNITYASRLEREARFAAFVKNLQHIDRFRQTEENGAVYSHLSPFADIAPDEFGTRHGLKFLDWVRPATSIEELGTADVPTSFDWREKGAINPVKDQKQCGSCWAFATVANIEGAAFVATGKLLSLSEQELVDCDTSTGDEGCQGGLPSAAYKDMIQNGIGLEPESAYPYKARGGKCSASKAKEVAFIQGWSAVSKDEGQIAAALVKYGPLAIGINAATMQFYHGGVAKPWHLLCSPLHMDHGVALVGFGVDESAKATDYWIIRNSWGPRWGERGYYRIIRGVGACGLNRMVTTATGVQIESAPDVGWASFVV
eukprot:CAMPEP_0176057478 /NCGR_PEP_ID=MMETSP0120_2-20121206/28628_1 /TAXON_ID=160619 /ORGANISM="Kryptoperidinium foliaceum, Strain CCMP 1326" /LENGTH=489 /DNA_ID=CAMNT_0017390989 /DNA_START=79 /DNA_END=1548 /DNA_ORIENTATION=+